MDLIEKSLQIALLAYSGLTDKAGQAYILHPLRVMSKMPDNHSKSAALLHDVLEDTNWTANDLVKVGIPQEVVIAVECLSKQKDQDYETYISRIKKNELARVVKLADIEDNINVLRLDQLEDKDLERVQQYHKAWKALQI